MSKKNKNGHDEHDKCFFVSQHTRLHLALQILHEIQAEADNSLDASQKADLASAIDTVTKLGGHYLKWITAK